MWTFVIAGTLYLIGVGVMLMIRPTFMFTPEGDWKEFGIGQREDRYTPFPFWLFCLVWAIVAYLLVMIIMNSSSNSSYRANDVELPEVVPNVSQKGPVELPKGYYVLNKRATKLSGVPKYVYLGTEEPE